MNTSFSTHVILNPTTFKQPDAIECDGCALEIKAASQDICENCIYEIKARSSGLCEDCGDDVESFEYQDCELEPCNDPECEESMCDDCIETYQHICEVCKSCMLPQSL